MTENPYEAVHAARRALDQEAMLGALEQNAQLRAPHMDTKRVHA